MPRTIEGMVNATIEDLALRALTPVELEALFCDWPELRAFGAAAFWEGDHILLGIDGGRPSLAAVES